MIGESPALNAVRKAVAQVAPTDATVLILGETGTGKELVAKAIHAQSMRKANPFVPVSCVALAPELITSELFGHEAGAFTGAVRKRVGRFEQAHTGTLFLDEIGEMTTDAQALLLRAIQERNIERVGGEVVNVNVRFVAATNRDLNTAVKQGRFREDLFYRLNVFPISLPPLRERRDDIPLLLQYFLNEINKRHQRNVTHISAHTLRLLSQYDWPGNIRELQNIVERGVIASDGVNLVIDPHWLAGGSIVETAKTWAAQERTRILDALKATHGRVYGPSGAAHRLGLNPTTLYGKMKKHGISKSDYPEE